MVILEETMTLIVYKNLFSSYAMEYVLEASKYRKIPNWMYASLQKLLQILQSTVLKCQIQMFSADVLKFQPSHHLKLFKMRCIYLF